MSYALAVELVDHTGLDATEHAALNAALAGLHTLHEVIRWGLAAAPERIVAEVIIQDEFTHDVVMPWTGDRYVVFDTT